jgi:proline-rich tail region repeat protein
MEKRKQAVPLSPDEIWGQGRWEVGFPQNPPTEPKTATTVSVPSNPRFPGCSANR